MYFIGFFSCVRRVRHIAGIVDINVFSHNFLDKPNLK